MKTYAFIDASNIIYGTRDDGWKVDFRKLFKYLKERYKCKKIYYFAGLDKNNYKQIKFYKILQRIGYETILKEVKVYRQSNGTLVKKANCDVDLTFCAMRDLNKFDRVIFLSGDGDFKILLDHFIKLKKDLIIFANSRQTAWELKTLYRSFNDLATLKKAVGKTKKRR